MILREESVSGTLGILLAGGRGTRLGQPTPKALTHLAGCSLYERALRTLDDVSVEMVVAAPKEIELPMLDARPGRRRERVLDAGEGPLAALVQAFEGRAFGQAIVLGVDFPLVLPGTLEALIRLLGPECRAVVPAPGGRLQPLVAAYAPSGAKALAAARRAGERSVVAAVSGLGPRVLDDRELARLPGGLESFLNLNRPQDLVEAERRLRQRAESA
jgi:molybdopterin-guanine dinucleotide biosynthesis protein A